MIIRNEQPTDYCAVENLTRETFRNVYRPGCTEHFVLNRYRNNPDFMPEPLTTEQYSDMLHRILPSLKRWRNR